MLLTLPLSPHPIRGQFEASLVRRGVLDTVFVLQCGIMRDFRETNARNVLLCAGVKVSGLTVLAVTSAPPFAPTPGQLWA